MILHLALWQRVAFAVLGLLLCSVEAHGKGAVVAVVVAGILGVACIVLAILG